MSDVPQTRHAQPGRSLRGRLTERVPIEQHDGASGAALERALLDDGTRLILKRFDPENDLTIKLAPDGIVREVELWRAGVLDRLPTQVGHPVVDAWVEDDRWVIAMRDLSSSILSYESRVSRDACRRFLAAANAMHATFRGEPVAGLWPMAARIGLFSRETMSLVAERSFPAWVLAGWERFADLAPPEVADAVFRIHADPGGVTGALLAYGEPTLLHGDLWLPNAALEPERVTLIDWALATWGTPIVEFVSFLVGCASQVEASREQLLDDIRVLMGEHHSEPAMRLGLILGVVEMGWNLAWHASEHEDPRAREPFDWWVARARDALATGSLG